MLDGYQLRDNTLSVERAKFQLKGQYDPSLKPKRRKNYKAKQKKTCERFVFLIFNTLVTQDNLIICTYFIIDFLIGGQMPFEDSHFHVKKPLL